LKVSHFTAESNSRALIDLGMVLNYQAPSKGNELWMWRRVG